MIISWHFDICLYNESDRLFLINLLFCLSCHIRSSIHILSSFYILFQFAILFIFFFSYSYSFMLFLVFISFLVCPLHIHSFIFIPLMFLLSIFIASLHVSKCLQRSFVLSIILYRTCSSINFSYVTCVLLLLPANSQLAAKEPKSSHQLPEALLPFVSGVGNEPFISFIGINVGSMKFLSPHSLPVLGESKVCKRRFIPHRR